MPKLVKAPPAAAPVGFDGIAPDALDFFRELDANNNREWFLANKARYERTIREPLGALVSSLALAFAIHEIPLTGDPKASLFRINRDVRFSNDKRPYKANASAVLTRDGTKKSQGLLYIQLGPDERFVAAGFYGLEPDGLEAFRRHVLAQPARWAKVEAALAKAGLTLSRSDAAVRLPRGFDTIEVGSLGDVIRLKTFVVVQPLTPQDCATPDLVDRLVAFARAALPLIEFGWSALSTLPPKR